MLYLFGCNSESNRWRDVSKNHETQQDFCRFLKERGLNDFAVLATCHRWECYWYERDYKSVEMVKAMIREEIFSGQNLEFDDFYIKLGPAVVNHLFRVSAGLDSLIIGEHEILGQVRDCLREALELKTAGPIIGTLLREAMSVGKKVRNQTAIGRGKVSYASLIIDLIEKNNWLNVLTEVLIIGTGRLAQNVAEILAKKGIKPYFVAGRSQEKAATLASGFQGEWAPLTQIPWLLNQFSLVVGVSKANQILIKNSDLATVTRQQMIIDLSVPGIVDSNVDNYKNIEYIGLNIVECMIQENIEHRQTEIETVEFLVAEAVEAMVVSIRQRQRQEQICLAQDQLYQEGQNILSKFLSEVHDENRKQEIVKQWNEQLKKLIYLALSAEKNEKLHFSPIITKNWFFPVILSLANRRFLVVGGGKVAARKIAKLLEAKAEIMVVAPELTTELIDLVERGEIHWRNSLFSPELLNGYDLVIAATDNQEVNLEVVTAARQAKILVNSVDEAIHSDFLFPAVIRRGDLLIAISTSGKHPALARKIRQELEFFFGQEYSELLSNKEVQF